jgi:uncharacterized protein YqjF (DUF2071 family)
MTVESVATNAAKIDRLAPTRRPKEPAIGYQVWSQLLFVHWRVPGDALRPLLPAALEIDTWDGDAWVGLVPFVMSGVRPWWFPPVPGVSKFLETNVRTYVHFQGRDPGVWFFSLEASNALAVRIARWRWHLAYYFAEMSMARRNGTMRYHSRRLRPGRAGAGCDICAEVGPLLGENERHREFPAGQAVPGTLEHFLLERYILYATDSAGRLFSGHVYHTPYPVKSARLVEVRESLLPAAGITSAQDPCHVAFSEGVSVDIFSLCPVERPSKPAPKIIIAQGDRDRFSGRP